MGRPREHDETTRRALLDAAERLVSEGGPDALSVRAAANDAGTTTRAVYSLFGGKDGLLVALAREAITELDRGLRRLKQTADPCEDLIRLVTTMYRGFVRRHPSLYRVAFQRIVPGLPLGEDFLQERERTFLLLEARVARLAEAGTLRVTPREGAVLLNVVCEGLANAEVRGGTLAPGDQERIWRMGAEALVRGILDRGRPDRRELRGRGSNPQPTD